MQIQKLHQHFLSISIAFALAAYASGADAQVFNEVSVEKQEDAKAQITIQLNTKLQFKSSVVASSNDVVTIFFDITGVDDLSRAIIEESKKTKKSESVPAFTVRFSRQAGQPTERRIDINFAKPVRVLKIGPGSDDQTLTLVLQTEVATVQPNPADSQSTTPSQASLPPLNSLGVPAVSTTDQQQISLLATAKASIERKDYESAVSELNQLLNMPLGAASQDAQELVGFVREKLGENKRALVEYELYLKLYPSGDGAERVKARIGSLAVESTTVSSTGTRERKPVTTSWGGISQYYYGGNSKIRDEFTIVTPATGATEIDIQNLSTTDQSSIVTDINYNVRHRTANWDSRFTFRDTYRESFLDTQPNRNRLSTAYVDLKNEKLHFGTRLGRQVAASGGVLGRFDGAILNYGFGSAKIRYGFEGGQLVEEGLGGSKRFAGLTIDADNIIKNVGMEFFLIQQNASGDTDRRAVGGEFRYFDDKRSVFSLFDYDILFNELNIASVQGNWSFNKSATLNFLYDYRRSPSLQMTNALLGQPETTLSQLAFTLTQDQIKAQALGLTPVSKVASIGATFMVSPRWQVGGDFRLSSVSGTTATATLPASPATGQVKTFSMQAIGTGLFIPSGVLVFNTSYLTSPAYDAILFGVSSRFKAGDKWILEPGIKYYSQDNAIGSTSKRLSPVGRVTYQFGEHIAFEGEINMEKTRTAAPLVNGSATSLFYYIGYRYDF